MLYTFGMKNKFIKIFGLAFMFLLTPLFFIGCGGNSEPQWVEVQSVRYLLGDEIIQVYSEFTLTSAETIDNFNGTLSGVSHSINNAFIGSSFPLSSNRTSSINIGDIINDHAVITSIEFSILQIRYISNNKIQVRLGNSIATLISPNIIIYYFVN